MIPKILITVSLLGILSGCSTVHYIQKPANSVTLYLTRPQATRVQFASSLDDYQAHDTRKTASGRWEIDVPGNTEFKYFYIVDGRVYLPACRYRERDDFGSSDCVFIP